VVRVVEGEVVAPIVEGVAELGVARERLQRIGLRAEPHAAAVHVEGSGRRPVGETDAAAPVAELLLEDDGLGRPLVGQVDPVVEAVEGPVHRVLRVGEGKPREHDLLDVGPPVAVRVLEVPDVGSGGDQDAAFPSHDTGGKHEAVREHGGVLVAAIVVAVLQQHHPARGPRVSG